MAVNKPPDILSQERIVDTDIHLSISEELLAEYASEPHASWLRAPSVQLKSPGWDPTMGGKIESRDLTSTEQIEEEVCGQLHVDEPILNVFRNLSRLSQTDTAVDLQTACNNLLLDLFLDDSDYHGLATVATQKPDAAAEEIDRISSEDQIVGVFLPTTGPNPPLGDPEYDVLYAAIEDHDLVPVYHGATNSGFDVGFPRHNEMFRKFVEAHVNAHLWSQTATVTSLLVNGVPEKFTELDFVILESGIGWVPYMMFRLNKEIRMRKQEAPLLERQPEEYIRDKFYFASQPLGEPMDQSHLQSIIEIIGVDSLVFASDYPHWDFDHPRELNKSLASKFSPDERSKVLNENAERVFSL